MRQMDGPTQPRLRQGQDLQEQVPALQRQQGYGRDQGAAAVATAWSARAVAHATPLRPSQELLAVIERGMPEGHNIVFERASEQTPETIPGDVVLIVRARGRRACRGRQGGALTRWARRLSSVPTQPSRGAATTSSTR
jgi:hypothetical protein